MPAIDRSLSDCRYIPHVREYFVHPAIVEGGRYVVPQHPGASTSIVSEEEAARIIASGAILGHFPSFFNLNVQCFGG